MIQTLSYLLGVIYLAQACSSCAAGRILNRFSSDIATVDDNLPFIANIALANIVSLLGILIILAYSQPLLLLLFIPLYLVYVWIQVIR